MALGMAVRKIGEIVAKVQPDGNPIWFSKHCKYVAELITENCRTDEDVQELFQGLNTFALASDEEEVAINLAHILTARIMETLSFQASKTTVRNEVLRILQGNFTKFQVHKKESQTQAHNSLALLGEFYNLLRINEQPINILGQSLLQLFTQELQEVLEKKTPLRSSLAKLIFTQVSLNGTLFKKHDPEKLSSFLDVIRRVIVESDNKSRGGKAYLMLSIDLYHCNFTAVAMVALQKIYSSYLDEPDHVPSPFDEEEEPEGRQTVPTATAATATEALVSAADAATNTSFSDDQHVPEKRQRVEMAVQTEVAICDVFRAGPQIVTPLERVSMATTCTNLSISKDDNSSKATPPSPSATNSSGTRKSKIDPRIRNVRIGRVYPNPKLNSSSPTPTVSPPRALSMVSTMDGGSPGEVAKLSIKNVTLHELAMMKENPSHLNRITNGYLDRLAPPSEIRCPSIKSSSEYTGKENDGERVEAVSGGGGVGVGPKESPRNGTSGSQKKSPNHTNQRQSTLSKIQMEENFDAITYDPSFFDDYVPHNNHSSSKSFLQFLENK